MFSKKIYTNLTEEPGVYIFKKDQNTIYIGKAINLKRRVSSYFDLHLEPKTARMISEANNFDYIKVTSELESLLLEAKLIRKYMPRYNIVAKDDKHPLYIAITKEEFPRVISIRKSVADNQPLIAIYGPFPSSRNVRSVLRMIRRIFPYSDHKMGKKRCLYSHMGLCSPCPNIIKTAKQKSEYLKNIRQIKSLLGGRIDKVKIKLEDQMKKFSKEEMFEKALEIREKIKRLEYITSPQMPVDFYIENPNLYEDLRSKELKALNKITGSLVKRIECFDIAHLAGSSPTASMVTFINGSADKSLYRHFRIKNTKAGDDYGAMREVARRRSRHFNSWGIPNLIIVDGGIGQVKAFLSQITTVPIVGIAKHPDRLIINHKKVKLSGDALNLVARMRDEAHRFARRYHHKLISNSIVKNEETSKALLD